MASSLVPASRPQRMAEGRCEPMGAFVRDGGVNFALWSDHAERVELCVFDAAGLRELQRYELCGPHDGVFHGFLPGAGPGCVYGFRAYGPYEPDAGHRFNPNKLLLDPWAREIVGGFEWLPEHHGYVIGHAEGSRSFDRRNNAAYALKARVPLAVAAPDGLHERPRTPLADMVLYEVHVRGFSQTHPGIPADLRGRYAALAHPVSIAHFKSLGVTTLSLLPVQYHLDEPGLAARGAVNYWGYNTLGFFAADPRFAMQPKNPSAVTQEFREMVAALHRAGLEVVLDVVYNHTPEGNEDGATLSFRGLDHASWYRLQPLDRSRCENLTGCGNTVNVAHPRVTQFVLDSLRFWVTEMGVDGFRFDLAPVLGRTATGFAPAAAFFVAMQQDPVLAQVHLIAEPWDAAPDGYQVGRFPGRIMEWNDKFRDAVRGYWLGAGVGRAELARRLTASSDLFQHSQRRPSASINFLSVHDGFTLADMVSYSRKHNEANGEGNRDGRDGELCANFGIEGPTEDAAIEALRLRIRRAMMATLLLAQGTPMLCAGDEIGNSQAGNNNAYCQDNRLGWLDWAQADAAFAAFVADCVALRRGQPLLHHDEWFGNGAGGGESPRGPIVSWHGPSGVELSERDWHDGDCHAFAWLLRAASNTGPALLAVFNPHAQRLTFELPHGPWRLRLDSSGELAADAGAVAVVDTPARAVLVFERPASAAGASLPSDSSL